MNHMKRWFIVFFRILKPNQSRKKNNIAINFKWTSAEVVAVERQRRKQKHQRQFFKVVLFSSCVSYKCNEMISIMNKQSIKCALNARSFPEKWFLSWIRVPLWFWSLNLYLDSIYGVKKKWFRFFFAEYFDLERILCEAYIHLKIKYNR